MSPPGSSHLATEGCWYGRTARPKGRRNVLILTRRRGEAVKIGDDITVAVLDVRGNCVRFGIEAPKSVPVHREEVYERILAEGEDDAEEE